MLLFEACAPTGLIVSEPSARRIGIREPQTLGTFDAMQGTRSVNALAQNSSPDELGTDEKLETGRETKLSSEEPKMRQLDIMLKAFHALSSPRLISNNLVRR